MHSKPCSPSLLGSKVLPLVMALVVGLFLTACDQSSQNIDIAPGNSLTVLGPGSVTIPNYDSTTTGEYMIRAFTIEQDYSWSVDGATLDGTRRDGEVAMVSTSTPGSFTVSVSTMIDGESYSGSLGTEASYPSALDQAEKYGLNTFSAAGVETGLVDQLASGLTVFVPSDAAFVGTFDADGNGELNEGELPPPGVLSSVILYHVTADSLTTSEISGGDEIASALHPEESVTFAENGELSVNGTESSAAFVAPDIATSEGAVLHKVDNVLLPSSVVSITEQTAEESNGTHTVTVSGTYVADGGFVALHEGSASGDIIGVSDYLEGSSSSSPDQGFHSGIEIELDSPLSDTTVIAMPHRDTNGDGLFTFVPNAGTDIPYFRGESDVPVIDSASVEAPSE